MAFTGPGLAVDWLDIEGPLNEVWPPVSHRVVFGDLELREFKAAEQPGIRPPVRKQVRQLGAGMNRPDPAFGIKPLRTMKLDELELVEIAVAGLDCKGCCLGAYEAIYRLQGVEKATASFKDGRVTALIDPKKTDRIELETALKQRGVQLVQPDSESGTN